MRPSEVSRPTAASACRRRCPFLIYETARLVSSNSGPCADPALCWSVSHTFTMFEMLNALAARSLRELFDLWCCLPGLVDVFLRRGEVGGLKLGLSP